MTDTNGLKSFNVFASETQGYYDENYKDNPQYALGHEPLQSLPATWYNSLMRDLTEQAQATKNIVDSIYAELVSVIDAASIPLSATQTDQLLNAILKITELQIATGSVLGGIYSSLKEWYVNVQSDGTAKVNTVLASATTTGLVQPSNNITVDADGVIDVRDASTAQTGAVQLNDTVTSTSTTQAATANAAREAYDRSATCITDLTISGSTITLTRLNGTTFTRTIPAATATRATYAKYLVNSDSPSGTAYVTADTSKNLSANTLTLG